MKKHTFHYDGITRTCRVYPYGRNKLDRFSTFIPANHFPDVEEAVPRMPVMAFKVRCQRRHHKIIIWPNGRITLAAHIGRSSMQAAKVAEVLGQKIRCFEVIRLWRKALAGYGDCKKDLPKPMQDLVDSCRIISGHRGRQQDRRSPLSTRDRAYQLRCRMRKNLLTELEEENPISSQHLRYVLNGWNTSDGVKAQFNIKRSLEEWSKEMIPAGLAYHPLRFHEKDGRILRLIPFHVAPSTIALGTGPCLCWSEHAGAGVVWAWIERNGKRDWKVLSVDS
jgi:hypothetical protein